MTPIERVARELVLDNIRCPMDTDEGFGRLKANIWRLTHALDDEPVPPRVWRDDDTVIPPDDRKPLDQIIGQVVATGIPFYFTDAGKRIAALVRANDHDEAAEYPRMERIAGGGGFRYMVDPTKGGGGGILPDPLTSGLDQPTRSEKQPTTGETAP